MFKRILVPLDGSDLARRAVPYAAALAKATFGRLVLVRVAWPFAGVLPRPEEEQSARFQRELDDLTRDLDRDGVEAIGRVYFGLPAPEILRAGHDENVDAIVMSTHGRTGVGRWLLGSVAEEVLRAAEVPVLLVPSDSVEPWTATRTGPVVLALDGSALADVAIEPALELARALGTTILLVQAAQAPEPAVRTVMPTADGNVAVAGAAGIDGGVIDRALDDVEAQLENAAARLRHRGVAIATRVELGDPASAIVRAASDADASAVVMATHRRDELQRLVLGSIAIGVVAQARRPVLLVTPAPVRAQRPASDRAQQVLIPTMTLADRATVELTHDEADLLCAGLNRLLDTSLADDELEAGALPLMRRLRGAFTPGVSSGTRS